jgi:hypothetical protein
MTQVSKSYIGDTMIISGPEISFQDNAVKAICDSSFGHGTGTTQKELAAVTKLDYAFRNQTSITKFDEFQYFTDVSYLNYYEFQGDTSLVSIKLPDNLIEIKAWAFSNCTSLKSIVIPESVTTLSLSEIFDGCSSLKSIEMKSKTPVDVAYSTFGSVGNFYILVPKGCKNTYKTAWSSFADYIYEVDENIPGVHIMYEDPLVNAICANKGWRTPEAVSFVSNLRNSEISFAYTNIKSFDELQYFTNLKRIGNREYEINDRLPGIFEHCYCLERIILPASITQISSRSFIYCPNLSAIYLLGSTPPDFEGSNGSTVESPYMFIGCDSLQHIYVPSSAVNAYKSKYGWKQYASIIEALPS